MNNPLSSLPVGTLIKLPKTNSFFLVGEFPLNKKVQPILLSASGHMMFLDEDFPVEEYKDFIIEFMPIGN